MNLNPEFQRNLWLEVTLHRLIGMPLVLGAVFVLVSLMPNAKAGAVAHAALGLFCLFTFGWGAYLAGETVTGEVKQRTWDLQRLSSIDPWSMTWGKLAGSTIYPWYGALICLLVVILGRGGYAPSTLAVLLVAAVLSQTIALLASLLAIRKGGNLNRSAAVAHVLIGNLAVAPFLGLLGVDQTIDWWGHAYGAGPFALLSVSLWTLWALVGCYRTMSTELQVAHTPMVWIGFCLFAWLYVIGFAGPPAIPTDALWHVRLFIGYGLATLLTYVTLFIDRKEPAAFRRMLVARAQGRWRRLWEEIPAWMPTLAMAGITAVVLAAQLLTLPDAVAANLDRDAEFIVGFSGVAWLIGTLLFTVRDVAIVLFFNLGPRRLRADLTAGLYLAILYALIPGILGAMDLRHAAAAFLPWFPLNPTVSLLSGLIQATLAAALVARRWRRGFGTPKAMTAD